MTNEYDNNDYGTETDSCPLDNETPLGEQIDGGNDHVEDENHNWPGDGSGEDDLADFNANEADDYRDEGADEMTCLGDEM